MSNKYLITLFYHIKINFTIKNAIGIISAKSANTLLERE